MLDTPCPACGHLLDINEDTCPHCGLPRRRGTAQPRQSSWLIISVSGLVGGWLGWLVAIGLAQREPMAFFGDGAVFLGSLLGLCLGILLTRRNARGG